METAEASRATAAYDADVDIHYILWLLLSSECCYYRVLSSTGRRLVFQQHKGLFFFAPL